MPNVECTMVPMKFEKRSINDILGDAQKINPTVVAAEVLKWLVMHVEDYVDSSNTIFKLDLIIDNSSNMSETKKLQDLYRAIPDDPNDPNAENVSQEELDNAQECRRTLDKVTEEAYKNIKGAQAVLDKLFERMIFYYEKVIPNPENRAKALIIDEELKVLIKNKEKTKSKKKKDEIQAQIVAKIKEGDALVKFEELTGAVNISKFEYEAFSLSVQLKDTTKDKDDVEVIMGEDEQEEEEKILNEYVVPEGFTIWLELNYKQKLRPTAVF